MRVIQLLVLGMFAIVTTIVVTGLDSAASPQTERIYYKDKAIVLLYHDVRQTLPPGEPHTSTISAGRLDEHLQMLNSRGFHIVSMDDFVRFMIGEGSLPPNAVVLTFDDGYETFYTEAFPVLNRFGATASNFVVGISSDLFNPDADPHLTWEQMRELKKRGMGIYSHTYNMHRSVPAGRTGAPEPALTARMLLEQKRQPESESAYRQRIFSDLTFMEKRLGQEIGKQLPLLAFPYGAYDELVLEEGARAGIKLFFSVTEGINAPGNRVVKRINAGEPYMTAGALWSRLQPFFENSDLKN